MATNNDTFQLNPADGVPNQIQAIIDFANSLNEQNADPNSGLTGFGRGLNETRINLQAKKLDELLDDIDPRNLPAQLVSSLEQAADLSYLPDEARVAIDNTLAALAGHREELTEQLNKQLQRIDKLSDRLLDPENGRTDKLESPDANRLRIRANKLESELSKLRENGDSAALSDEAIEKLRDVANSKHLHKDEQQDLKTALDGILYDRENGAGAELPTQEQVTEQPREQRGDELVSETGQEAGITDRNQELGEAQLPEQTTEQAEEALVYGFSGPGDMLERAGTQSQESAPTQPKPSPEEQPQAQSYTFPEFPPALIRQGDCGEHVAKLQGLLNDVNTLHGNQLFEKPLGTDGAFGPQTKEALTGVQETLGIEPDGVFGPDTLKAIKTSMLGRMSGAEVSSSISAAEQCEDTGPNSTCNAHQGKTGQGVQR